MSDELNYEEVMRVYKKLIDLTSTAVEEHTKRIKDLERLLSAVVLASDVTAVRTEIDIEPRRFKELIRPSLRCVSTEKMINRIVINNNMLHLAYNEKLIWGVDLREVTAEELLKLTCNVKEEDLDKLIQKIRETGSSELDRTIDILKKLVTYAEILTK
jgi:hypothetical protein